MSSSVSNSTFFLLPSNESAAFLGGPLDDEPAPVGKGAPASGAPLP